MFDNEIDWVMRIRSASSYQAAEGWAEGMRGSMTQYKAEHIVEPQRCGACKCSMQKECL